MSVTVWSSPLPSVPVSRRILPYAPRVPASDVEVRRYSRNSGPRSGRWSASSTVAWSQPIVVPAS